MGNNHPETLQCRPIRAVLKPVNVSGGPVFLFLNSAVIFFNCYTRVMRKILKSPRFCVVQSRIRKDHGPANYATLQHPALSLRKQEKTPKIAIHGSRLSAGRDNSCLELLLIRIVSAIALRGRPLLLDSFSCDAYNELETTSHMKGRS